MVNAGLRIALLAKAGDARRQLQTALTDLGAELVCEGDPSEINPQSLLELRPSVVVVGLEPSLDKSLLAFDDVLNNSQFEVVYDDAEVSGQLTGWDLNRWARHLAAKLIGSDLMPPVPAGSSPLDELVELSSPGAPETPAQMMADAKFEDYLDATSSMAIDVPASTDFAEALERDKGSLSVEEPRPALDIDFDDLEKAMTHQPIELTAVAEPELPKMQSPSSSVADDFINTKQSSSELDQVDDLGAFADFSFDGFDDVVAVPPVLAARQDSTDHENESALNFSLDYDTIFGPDLSGNVTEKNAVPETDSISLEDDLSTLADFEPNKEAISFSNYNSSDEELDELSIDDDVAALAAQLDAMQEAQPAVETVKDLAFENDVKSQKSDRETETENVAVTENRKPNFDFSSLELADESAPLQNQATSTAAEASQLLNKVNFELEPTDEEKAAAFAASATNPDAPVMAAFGHSAAAGAPAMAAVIADTGAVLILAGMGGPDAVRQLLKALPKNFSPPVLLYQHLEVGNHDRLVTQLGKISQLPVYLAANGKSASAGQVAVLSAGVGIDFVAGQLQFGSAESQQQLVATMPSQHSAIVILSGAAVEAAEAAAYVNANGGVAFAQEPSNCFESAAANALIAQGGKTAEIVDIASMLVAHFAK
jgi:chemosensory pili system protein ChpB (putative protein-glutamate methylesterase)